MRIIEIVPTVEQEASGPSYSVPRLAKALTDLGHDVHLMTVGGQALKPHANLRHTRYRKNLGNLMGARSLWLSDQMRLDLNTLAAGVDLIHTHGLWVMPNVYPSWATRRAGKLLVMSPRGTLSPVALALSRWRKRLFWHFLQKRAIVQAGLLHATSEQEYLDIRAAGLTQPVAIIPNGIDIPVMPAKAPRNSTSRSLLYLGRLHPIKGLDMLLQAWGRLQREFPDWDLKLVGPGEVEHQLKLKQLAATLKLERVTFAGPLYGAEKDAVYAQADLFILPSFSENFGMSIAEALAGGVPVVTTTGTPWKMLDEQGAGWCVAPELAALEAALFTALGTSAEKLRQMGARGRVWMEQDFSWEHVAAQMQAAYRWALQRGPLPDCVRLS